MRKLLGKGNTRGNPFPCARIFPVCSRCYGLPEFGVSIEKRRTRRKVGAKIRRGESKGVAGG